VALSAGFSFSLLLALAASAHAADSAAPVSRIAFGSCARQTLPEPIWDAILEWKPEAMLLLGDTVYADTADPEILRATYAQLAANPSFTKLRQSTRLLATWDDHDYGENDAGGDFPARDASKKVFLDFLGEPGDSPRWTRDGIYQSYDLGPVEKRIQVILLDTRSFRSPLTEGHEQHPPGDGRPGPYVASTTPGATILGDAQWEWLEGELLKPARLRVLVSSIQVIAEDHGFEKWMNIPAERERLLTLIASTHASGVVIVSGDRHAAELSLLPAGGRVDALTGARTPNPAAYPLFDLTSSPFNVTRPWTWEINRHRVGDVFWGANFGTLEVDWRAPDPAVTLGIRDDQNRLAFFHRFPLSSLDASATRRTP
jgi:alkaline phosphatase D